MNTSEDWFNTPIPEYKPFDQPQTLVLTKEEINEIMNTEYTGLSQYDDDDDDNDEYMLSVDTNESDPNKVSFLDYNIEEDVEEDVEEDIEEEEIWNYLTDGQQKFLQNLASKNYWYGSLYTMFNVFYDLGWEQLQNDIERVYKYISYDDFHYLGVPFIFVNNDQDKLNILLSLKEKICNWNNDHYADIAKRLYTDYRINLKSFDDVKETLERIANLRN